VPAADVFGVGIARRSSKTIPRVLVALLVGCVGCSGSGSASRLTDYAAGNWTCRFAALPGLPRQAKMPTVRATVTAPTATKGRVRLVIDYGVGAAGRVMGAGVWALRSKHLVVKWDTKNGRNGDFGMTEAEPIAIDTKRFTIRDDSAGSHWLPVKVNRQARTVTFSFRVLPDEPVTQITCQKV
jgi:hypothetical protein